MMPWSEVPVSPLALHDCRALDRASSKHLQGVVQEADRILAGEFRLFSFHQVAAGFSPDWHADQLEKAERLKTEKLKSAGVAAATSQITQALHHWADISDSGSKDIKGVWELSRFPWAFSLTRAYAITEDSRYRDAFWILFTDWCDQNPPNTGPNWMCGQEATFRLMAVLFAVEGMELRKDDERTRVARFVVATGERIAANLSYALSQKNNHGVSECVGLITTALTVPNHGESSAWLDSGLKNLREQLDELVYEDGSFSQDSLIYHRVLLHDLTWGATRLRKSNRDVPEWLRGAAGRALDFLMKVTDPVSGTAPLFGSNDGANVLPLSEADYLDMRPTIQMASAVLRETLPLPEGPWDEAAEWMVGSVEGMRRTFWPQLPDQWLGETGGYAQLSSGGDRLFIRCPSRFRHRPAQADMLQVDVWLNGKAVAEDGGSFSYNTQERFKDLSQAHHHNVLTVDGMEPLKKFSRFLYLPWPKGGVEKLGAKSSALEDTAEGFRVWHDGYANLGVIWYREVSKRLDGGFVVRDIVKGAEGRRLIWHWRLSDGTWALSDLAEKTVTSCYAQIRLSGTNDAKVRLIRADAESAYGWSSKHYATVVPSTSLLIEIVGREQLEMVFEFLPIATES